MFVWVLNTPLSKIPKWKILNPIKPNIHNIKKSVSLLAVHLILKSFNSLNSKRVEWTKVSIILALFLEHMLK